MSLHQASIQERIRSNLKNTLNLENSAKLGGFIQMQSDIVPQLDEEPIPLNIKKAGLDRLKMIINFAEEAQLKPVIQQGEIQKEQKKFEQKYRLGDKVGEGAHAIVRKANKYSKNKIDDPKVYAVKIFRSGDPEIINTIKKTYNNSRFLNHPLIAATIELFINEKTENAYLVMEYCPFPSLEDVIKKSVRISEQVIQGIAHDLLKAVGYIHLKGICHRDIKPDNILMDDSNQSDLIVKTKIKLVDFGVSKRFLQIIPGKVGSHTMDMWTCTGNIHYCAPEIFQGGGYNASIDVWAVGVVLYQCLTGCLPFHEDTQMDTIEAIRNENGVQFQEGHFKGASKIIQDFLKRLLKVDPKQRISVEEALEHPFITSVQSVKQKSDSMKSKDDGQIQHVSKQTKEMLTKSSQMGDLYHTINYHSRITQDITEEQEDFSPTNREVTLAKRVLEEKLVQFKEETQLTTIHFVKKPEIQTFGPIDLVASFNTYANGSLGAKNHFGLHLSSTIERKDSLQGLVALSESSELLTDGNLQTDGKQPIQKEFDFEVSIVSSMQFQSEEFSETIVVETIDSLGCKVDDEIIEYV